MPIEVELPDGSVAEFPDGFGTENIKMVLARTAAKNRSWADVPGEALSNVPTSAVKFAKALVQPILHPIETGKSLFDVGYGLASKAAGALGVEQDPTDKSYDEASVNSIGHFFKDRYGSADALKKTLATDPIGALGDASLVLTGGGAAAARVPGVVGASGRAVGAVGRAVDPINMAASSAAAAGRTIAPVLGVTTGTGALPIRTAFEAGRDGNPTLAEHMRGQRPITEAVDMAEAGVNAMVGERGRAYRAGTDQLRNTQTPIDFAPVARTIQDAGNSLHHRGIIKDQYAAQVHTQMVERLHDFMALPPVERTPEALDALKQAIGNIRDAIPYQQTNARRVAGDVYRSIGAEIRRQVPSYDAAMRGYAEASDNINEMRRTLSINDRASTDTTLRKLQSVMRNNVNTNYGQRQVLAEQLAQHQPNIMPALAGQALNSWEPRGLARMGANVSAVGSLMTNPTALAALPLASPRLVGEAAYGLGNGARMVRNIQDLIDIMSRNTARPATRGARHGANTMRALGLLADEDK